MKRTAAWAIESIKLLDKRYARYDNAVIGYECAVASILERCLVHPLTRESDRQDARIMVQLMDAHMDYKAFWMGDN